MSIKITIRKNTLYSFISILSRLIVNVLLFLIIARYFGPNTFGQFTFAHSLSFIFILFADFGIDILFTNVIAKNRDDVNKLFGQYFTLKICLTLLAFVGMLLFSIVIKLSTHAYVLVLMFSIYMVFNTLTNFLFSLLKGYEKLDYESKVSVYSNSLLLLLTLILLLNKANIFLISSAFIFSRIVGFLLILRYTKHYFPNLSFKLTFKGLRDTINSIIPWGIHLTFNYLFFQIDTILLAFLISEYEVGIYQSVIKLILIPLLIPDILTNTLTPTLARFNVENRHSWERIAQIMYKILFVSILPIMLIFFIYADSIIHFFYGGKEFSSAIPVLQIFAFVILVRFNAEPFALLLTTSNKQHIRMKVVVLATIINILLNFYMIPNFGGFGAAIVSLITNIFVGVSYFIQYFSLFTNWIINKKNAVLLLVTILILFSFLYIYKISIMMGVPIIILVYLLIAYFYFFTKEERDLFLPEYLTSLSLNQKH